MAGVCPVAIGSSLAYRDGGWHGRSATAALAAALAIQIGTNYCNDYCDFIQGADTEARVGPRRAVQAGLVTPAAMRRATVLLFAIVALLSALLATRAGWPILVLGAVSILLGVLYTAGRHSLAYLGLGDLFVLVFFGPVAVAGTYFVQTRSLRWPIVVAGLAPGLLSVGILVVNNLRDHHQDRLAGKRTLAVRLGPEFARWQYLLCLWLAAAVPVVLWLTAEFPLSILAASVAILPGWLLAPRLWSRQGAALNPLLGQTAALLLGYTMCFFGRLCVHAMNLKAYRYRLQLEPPLSIGQRTLTHREGVLLSPVDQPYCWGDAAPLPGLSRETVEDVIRGLQVDTGFQPPSLRFALQSLKLPGATGRVPVNALLQGTRAAMLHRARELRDLPFQAVKLKVGWQRSVADEIELVRELRQQLRDDQRLRLDANRRWTLEQAVRFGKGVSSLDIEYIEEPLIRPRECEAFFERTGVPYALDETLAELPRLEWFPHVDRTGRQTHAAGRSARHRTTPGVGCSTRLQLLL